MVSRTKGVIPARSPASRDCTNSACNCLRELIETRYLSSTIPRGINISRTIEWIISSSERKDFSVWSNSRKISSIGPAIVSSEWEAGGRPGDNGGMSPGVSGLRPGSINGAVRRGGTGVNGGFELRMFIRSV